MRCEIVSTPETRRICNDPLCMGVEYTRSLCKGCAEVLRRLRGELQLVERETVVVNILRGGLNFGLREALADAYGWNLHTTSFLSAQRRQDERGEWGISETAYRKVCFPKSASLVMGDVVATGTSLRYALETLLKGAEAAGTELKSIVFFTFGGPAARQILTEADRECRARFPGYRGTTLIYLEGEFAVPDESSKLRIRLPGTDLVRVGAKMAPEFVESQYENPAYPLERCVIYDAGSRAFQVEEYLADVRSYWRQVLALAESGVTFEELLKERFPMLDASRFGAVDLKELCQEKI